MTRASDEKDRKDSGAFVWTVLALVGTAAIAFIVARKVINGEEIWDADRLLEAADRAANQLDLILMSESQAVV
jgi:hypothetical protein